MKVKARGRQLSYGEAIGILLIENYAPFIPGDVANATSYRYPVRYQPVMGLTVDKLFRHDTSSLEEITRCALHLQEQGVKAITGDCGFLALFQKELSGVVDVPLFLSSLLQLNFIFPILSSQAEVIIVTASSHALTPELFENLSIREEYVQRCRITGLEDCESFAGPVIEEQGVYDTDEVERCVVERALEAQHRFPRSKAVLLECSLLPPFAAAVTEATGLPVFDYITMIDYVHDAVVKQTFTGHM